MKTFKQHLDEKTEYYFDTSQNNADYFVAFDGISWYQARVGIRGEDLILKFVLQRGKNSYFEDAKLKKVTPQEVQKAAGGTPVDLKKLYKR